jgi:hypothetical protein
LGIKPPAPPRSGSRLAVIYTPYDLLSGVNRESNAYARGLAPDDALRVTMNLVTYALTH